MSALSRSAAVVAAYGLSALSLPGKLLPRKRLTERYLSDPAIRRGAPPEEEPIRLVR
jgi:hypothetical protein